MKESIGVIIAGLAIDMVLDSKAIRCIFNEITGRAEATATYLETIEALIGKELR